MKYRSFLILILFYYFLIFAQQNEPYPLYITGSVPINEYTLFANSGWDGNWYVGTNMCWIKVFKKDILPKKENFSRFFVGVKLGRAKTIPKLGAPSWEKDIVDGNIYVGVSSTPAWKSDQRYFLCKISDIPTEGDWENAITTTGEAKWFFVEIPFEKIDFSNDVWICVYSNTPYLTTSSSAPILAGGWRERKQKESFVWLNNEINGSPPIDPSNSLKTQIRAFDPAIILKLIPKEAENLQVMLKVSNILEGRPDTKEKVFFVKPLTPNIQQVWMEISFDNKNFEKISKYQYQEPFAFNLKPEILPKDFFGKFWIRFAAKDIFENIGYSEEIMLEIKNNNE